jgi:glycosyltransferase involved in cell wall biosynthesis
MKILVITSLFPDNPSEGDGKFIYDSVEALHKLGHEISILVIRGWRAAAAAAAISDHHKKKHTNLFPDWVKIQNCYYFSFPRYILYSLSLGFYAKKLSLVLRKCALEWQYDLIHVHSEAFALAAVKAGRKMKIPVVVTLHGVETNRRYWKGAGNTIRKGLESANRIIFVGDSLKNMYDQMMPNMNHFSVVYNGFDAPFWLINQAPAAWAKEIRIVSVSNLTDPAKKIDVTLRALSLLNQRGITWWNYKIIGEGRFNKKLQKLANQLRIDHQITFSGYSPHYAIYDYLCEANIFCLVSSPEAFGIAHLEAMASGLLVIAGKGQGPEAFVTHDETGLLAVPNNVEALADTLEYAFRNSDRMKLIASTGKNYVWKEFTWAQHAKHLEQVYMEACKHV